MYFVAKLINTLTKSTNIKMQPRWKCQKNAFENILTPDLISIKKRINFVLSCIYLVELNNRKNIGEMTGISYLLSIGEFNLWVKKSLSQFFFDLDHYHFIKCQINISRTYALTLTTSKLCNRTVFYPLKPTPLHLSHLMHSKCSWKPFVHVFFKNRNRKICQIK